MAITYEPIATTTLGSAASTITFSSIPNTYTDLRLVLTGTNNTGTFYVRMRFNNDTTGSNYSFTQLGGNGTSATSTYSTNPGYISLNYLTSWSTTIPTLQTVDIFSYTGSTYKTSLVTTSADQNGSGSTEALVGLWQSTSAITTITLLAPSNSFNTGTTATLYGIKAA